MLTLLASALKVFAVLWGNMEKERKREKEGEKEERKCGEKRRREI